MHIVAPGSLERHTLVADDKTERLNITRRTGDLRASERTTDIDLRQDLADIEPESPVKLAGVFVAILGDLVNRGVAHVEELEVERDGDTATVFEQLDVNPLESRAILHLDGLESRLVSPMRACHTAECDRDRRLAVHGEDDLLTATKGEQAAYRVVDV